MATAQDAIVLAAKKGAMQSPEFRALVWQAATKEGLQIPWDRLSAQDVAAFGGKDYMTHAMNVASNKKHSRQEGEWLNAMAQHGLIPGTRLGQIMAARLGIEMGSPAWNPMAAVNEVRGKKKPVPGKVGSALSGHDPGEALRTAQQQSAALDYARGSGFSGAIDRAVADNSTAGGIDASQSASDYLDQQTGVAGALTRATRGMVNPQGVLIGGGLAVGLPAATALAGALPGAAGAIGSRLVPLAADAYFAQQAIPGAVERYKQGDKSGALADLALGVGPVAAYGIHGLRSGVGEAISSRVARGEALLRAAEDASAATRAQSVGRAQGFGALDKMSPEFLKYAAENPMSPYATGRLAGGISRGLLDGELALGGNPGASPGIMGVVQPALERAAAESAAAYTRASASQSALANELLAGAARDAADLQAARSSLSSTLDALSAHAQGRALGSDTPLSSRVPVEPIGPGPDLGAPRVNDTIPGIDVPRVRPPLEAPPDLGQPLRRRRGRIPKGGTVNPSEAPAGDVAPQGSLTPLTDATPATPNDIHALGGATDPISAVLSGAVDTRLPHESAGVPSAANAAPGQGSIDVVRTPSDASPRHWWMSPTSHIDIQGAIEQLFPEGAKLSGTLRHYRTVHDKLVAVWSKAYKSIVDDVRVMGTLGNTPKERWETFQRMIETERSQRGTLAPNVKAVMDRYDALTDQLGQYRETSAIASGIDPSVIAPSIKDIGYWSRQHKGGYQVVRPHVNPDGTVRIEHVAFAKNMTEASNEALRIINEAHMNNQPAPKLQIIEANKGEVIPGVGQNIGKPQVGMNIGRVKNNLEYDRSPQVMQEHIQAVARFGHRVATDALIKDALKTLHPTQTQAARYLMDYRKRLVGAPNDFEVQVGNAIRGNRFLRDRISDPDRFIRTSAAYMRTVTNMLKLRFNLKSAAINLVQPEQTLAPIVGEKIFRASRAKIKSEWQRMKDEHVLIGDTKYDEHGNASVAGGGGKWYDVMSNASNVNRAHGYLAGEMHWDTLAPEVKKTFMKNGRFSSESAARDQYARDMAERTEFDNTVHNRALAMTGPFVETLMQYKGYQIKSMESTLSLLSNPKNGNLMQRLGKVARSAAAPAILGGAKGTLAVIGGASAPFVYSLVYDLAQKHGVDNDTSERLALGASEGLPAVAGVNTAAAVQPFDAPFGNSPAEKVGGAVMGPSFGSQAKFAVDFWNVMKEPNPHTREQYLWQLVVHQVPQMAGVRLAAEQIQNPGSGQAVGMERTESQNPALDATLMVGGFQNQAKMEHYARKEREAARKFMGYNMGLGG